MTPDTALLVRLLTTAALIGATVEYVEVIKRRVARRAGAPHRDPAGPRQADPLKRATAAWWAGSEELDRVAKLPGASSAVGSIGVLSIGDARVERGALNVATAKLATLLGTLQATSSTARAWGAEIGQADLKLPAQIEAVDAQTRRVRALRESYEAGRGRR